MDLKIDEKSMEQLIKGHIMVAAADVLSKQSPVLVERLVKEALEKKSPNSYSHNDPSMFEKAVQDMIRTEAQEACKVWLDEQRPLIRRLVYESIKRKDNGLAQKIADQLVGGLAGGLNVTAYLSGKDR